MKARRHARFENREASALNEIKFALVLPEMVGGTKTGEGKKQETKEREKRRPEERGEKRKKGKRRPGKGTRLPFPC